MSDLQSRVETAIKTAYKDMDVNGMYPSDWACLGCGAKLNADGGHPAELYAGTFNGLCYSCTAKPRYLERVHLLDGAYEWNYAPHCPSWRRDREREIGFPDCAECQGFGVAGFRSHHRRSSCKSCWDRYIKHPERVSFWQRMRETRRAADVRYNRLLQEHAGCKKRTSQVKRVAAVKALLNTPEGAAFDEALRARLFGECERIDKLLTRRRKRVNATATPAELTHALISLTGGST